MRCDGCGKQLRAHGVSLDDAPGTVSTGRAGLCQTCTKRRGTLNPVPEHDDGACIVVKVTLRPSTYRAFAAHAKDLHLEVGDILARLADRSVRPQDVPAPVAGTKDRRTAEYVEDDTDRRIRELNAQGLSDNAISKLIGIAQSSTSRRRRLLGLQPPRPRYGGRRKAA